MTSAAGPVVATTYGYASRPRAGADPAHRGPSHRSNALVGSEPDDLVVAPHDSLVRALDKASRNGIGRLAVMDGGRLRGYLSLKDITHVLTLHAPPGQAAEARDALRPAA